MAVAVGAPPTPLEAGPVAQTIVVHTKSLEAECANFELYDLPADPGADPAAEAPPPARGIRLIGETEGAPLPDGPSAAPDGTATGAVGNGVISSSMISGMGLGGGMAQTVSLGPDGATVVSSPGGVASCASGETVAVVNGQVFCDGVLARPASADEAAAAGAASASTVPEGATEVLTGGSLLVVGPDGDIWLDGSPVDLSAGGLPKIPKAGDPCLCVQPSPLEEGGVVMATLSAALDALAGVVEEGEDMGTEEPEEPVTPPMGYYEVPEEETAAETPAPTDAAPADAAPTDALPSDTAPTDAAPADAAPTDAAPQRRRAQEAPPTSAPPLMDIELPSPEEIGAAIDAGIAAVGSAIEALPVCVCDPLAAGGPWRPATLAEKRIAELRCGAYLSAVEAGTIVSSELEAMAADDAAAPADPAEPAAPADPAAEPSAPADAPEVTPAADGRRRRQMSSLFRR